MKFKGALIALAVVLLQVSAFAAPQPYFSGSSISPRLLDKPYANNSFELQEDTNYIIKLQKHADKNEVKKAAAEYNLTSESVAMSVDHKLIRRKYPSLYRVLDRAGVTAEVVTGNAKKYWNVQRPYVANKNIKPLITAHTNPSYPSGHTAKAHVLAYILGVLEPAKKKEFYARAEEISNHRVLVGMHYPHDIAAGRKMAELLDNRLLNNNEFRKDLAAARKEMNR